MNIAKLNPYIRSVGMYEALGKSGECRAYDARLFYMVSGDISISIGGERAFHLSVGNLLYIPAGTSYKLKGEYFRCAAIAFDPTDDFCDTPTHSPVIPTEFDEALCHSGELAPFDKVMLLTDAEAERDNIIRICNTAVSAEGEWQAEISARVKLLLLKLAESVSEHALPAQMVEALDTYIRENCTEEISNTEIGAIFGYHPFYVSRMLKDKKGITMRQYIIAYRLKSAMALLRSTKKTVAEIAEETGFTDASYFTKTFRQTFSMTPKEYRNKFKEEFI